MGQTIFKPGDRFILELGNRRVDKYEIAGTDLYVKIESLKKLTPYKPDYPPNSVKTTAECIGCKWDGTWGDMWCDRCARMYFDRYEANIE